MSSIRSECVPLYAFELLTAPAPLRLASAARAEEAVPRKAAAGKPVPAAMPPSAKLAMARLTTQAVPARTAEKPGAGKPSAKGVAEKKTLVASKASAGKSAEPAHGAKPGARYAGIY